MLPPRPGAAAPGPRQDLANAAAARADREHRHQPRARPARRAGGADGRRRGAAALRLRQGPGRPQARQGPLHPRRGRLRRSRDGDDRGGSAGADPGRVRGAAGGVRSAGGAGAGCATRARRAVDEPPRPPLPLQPRRRRGRAGRRRRRRRGHVPAELRHAGVPGHDGRRRRLGSRRQPHDVVDDAGAVSLPARSVGGPGDRRRPRASDAAAGRRQLRPRPRHLPDRRHRGAARARGAASGEGRVRPSRGVHRLSHPRALRDPAAYRRRPRRPAARARRARDDRRGGLHVVGLDHAVRDALHGRRALPGAERALRHHDRLHQQPLLRIDARLRQPRIDLRGRVADGRSGRPARDRSPRAAAAQSVEARRR